MRLIDADKLAEKIADSINDASIQNDELSLSILRVFKKTVDDEPSIDAEPVKRGWWEVQELAPEKWKFCSDCGYANKRGTKWDYCPNCGAKMRWTEDTTEGVT